MDSIRVPDGFRLHTENTSHILLSANDAFLNPVQEFNRDMSVACIRTWSEDVNRERETKWRKAMEGKAARAASKPNKKLKGDVGQPISTGASTEESRGANGEGLSDQPQESSKKPEAVFRPYKFVLLEALSATGLRSIRYAKEIPLLSYVIANDLSEAAVDIMKRNIELNGLVSTEEASTDPSILPKVNPGKVRVNEGDACALMYNHREEKKRVDVVDLDPYGTAAPFVDAAVQCVTEGGLLCVTCTDLAVLATTNYPEKCFANYGGVSVKAEYAHEAALRLVLHSISTAAARYGRYIEPILSLSIDFYVRVFIRVRMGAFETKKALAKTANYYICSHCSAWYEQPLGRVVEKVHERSGHVNVLFKTQAGPTVSEKCPECESTLHIAGPMWSGPLHDPAFVDRVLEHVEANQDHYGTAPRMKGMLTLAKEEITSPFYFTPSKLASAFHCCSPSLNDIASALLHAGHKISRSHACAGSLKTSAPHRDVHDVYRCWIQKNPVKMENIGEGSPARKLLAKKPQQQASFERHPDSVTPSSEVKLVRYQQNPTSHWGPKPKADPGAGSKRKRGGGEGAS
ncbi:tRNA (guanine(26)-N(2))-dimethyltransferase [Leucoagaricus sp. SymC.cos]|nr:tRNA (guanine(26)-N(2))-dimethyltransferase [Leucoagaricus sp. SymC.cos]